jgi:uncharacterized lipoprotein YddW (UPF0748 family)
MLLKIPIALWLLIAVVLRCEAATYEPSNLQPPRLDREFRGLWIATVANIDWPSKPGLRTAEQKAELISILDRAADMNLNAVIFRVRPACDAFYASSIEPWSEYLTGAMGKAPNPFYDPLAFAITEAHKRGLELHAWFNPYRALHKSHEGSVAPNHISRTHPQFVKRYGQYLWLDPGERGVQDHSLSVVMDVVKRYDIDAVHFDDYFYPDPGEAPGRFPDQTSWRKYGVGGKLSFEDWRRENVNMFIERTYRSIKSTKPWVKFGISPHGIWRPGNPPQIRGADNYVKLSADSRKWLANGWLDYFSPQLYWTNESKEQSFPALLDWWKEQNVKGRHLWPGMSASYALRDKWKPAEIPNQIEETRRRPEVTGYILYSSSKLFANAPLANTLKRNTQSSKALVPASPWLNRSPPSKPAARVSNHAGSMELSWTPGNTNALRWWVVQRKIQSGWNIDILPAEQRFLNLGIAPDIIAVTAIDQFGSSSASVVLRARKAIPSPRLLQR